MSFATKIKKPFQKPNLSSEFLGFDFSPFKRPFTNLSKLFFCALWLCLSGCEATLRPENFSPENFDLASQANNPSATSPDYQPNPFQNSENLAIKNPAANYLQASPEKTRPQNQIISPANNPNSSLRTSGAELQNSPQNQQWCNNRKFYHQRILQEARIGNFSAIENLPACFKQDRSLIVKLTLIDPALFRFAANLLKKDESFVKRMINVNPKTLQFASNDLRASKSFMRQAIMVNREALAYGDNALLDDLPFMKEMIDIDSGNYKFGSSRIRAIPNLVKSALEDNGILLEFAPEEVRDDLEMVRIAVISNRLALKFASKELQNNSELRLLTKSDDSEDDSELNLDSAKQSKASPLRFDEENLAQSNFEKKIFNFLQEAYLTEAEGKNLSQKIGNFGRFFKKNQLINRNFVARWKKSLYFDLVGNGDYKEEWRLVPAKERNFNISWRKDFEEPIANSSLKEQVSKPLRLSLDKGPREFDGLIERIEDFFLEHGLNLDSINDLQTTFLWKIKNSPATYAFNIYLLRDSRDADLGPDFANVTSLTAIAQKNGDKWRLSVVEAIFDKEIAVGASYTNGHKRYLLWDLLPFNYSKLCLNPKICQENSAKSAKIAFQNLNLKEKLLALQSQDSMIDFSETKKPQITEIKDQKTNSKITKNSAKNLFKKDQKDDFSNLLKLADEKASSKLDEKELDAKKEELILKQISESNPKIIFRVEGAVEDHFEIFEEQKSGKYQMIYRSPTLPSLLDFKNLE